MPLKARLHALGQIYQVYDEFIQTQDLVCQKHCAWCCTCDVTLTTLEGLMIVNHLKASEKLDLLRVLRQKAHPHRLLPEITTNHMALLCARGEDFDETERHLSSAACPLLDENTCPIYNVRPFGCRSLVSHQPCENNGYATTSDYILSVNTLFMQAIEHLDSGGRFGNLTDILIVLGAENQSCSAPQPFKNTPIAV